jgi:hypothetical protein
MTQSQGQQNILRLVIKNLKTEHEVHTVSSVSVTSNSKIQHGRHIRITDSTNGQLGNMFTVLTIRAPRIHFA